MSAKSAERKPRTLLCSLCRQLTNHEVMSEYSARRQDEVFDWGWTGTLLRCMGCDTPSLEVRRHDSEDFDENGETLESVDLYPPRSLDVEEIKGLALWRIPYAVQKLYQETLTAIRHEAPILAAVGLRATVEAVCADQGVPGKNLKKRIDALVEGGMLAKGQAEFLHLHRLLGNDAVHEFKAPDTSELIASLQILQTLLRTVYELPRLAAAVERGRKRREQ